MNEDKGFIQNETQEHDNHDNGHHDNDHHDNDTMGTKDKEMYSDICPNK